MTKKFKAGDRVRVKLTQPEYNTGTGCWTPSVAGKIGVVTSADYGGPRNFLGIDFGEYIQGDTHYLSGYLVHDTGRWMNPEDLELLTKKKIV